MQLGPGKQLVHYEISALLGSGGMGDVWRARDGKLGREVAIKVLPEEFAADAERLSRFEREARLLASLDHPNVASIYGIEEVEGTKFLVMQLAEGEDLAARIERGAMPIDDALAAARQMIDALEAAHEKGIVHRDLKPANIKIDGDGNIRVLDFGLAKALDGKQGDPDLTSAPTIAGAVTHAGVILGTAAYMSPEQARGRAADKRADIWAFGVVLWEMLTGARLFAGETVSDTLAGILTREVDLDELPAAAPAPVRELIAACLIKDPRQRLRDIGDARLMLDRQVGERQGTAVAGKGSHSRLVAAILAVALVAGLVGAWLSRLAVKPAEGVKRTFRLAAVEDSSFRRSVPVISPDGRKMTWIREEELFLVDLATSESRAVADSTGARYAGWAPDSLQFAFMAGSRLWKHDIASGKSTPLAAVEESAAGGVGWLADGRIVFCSGDSELFVVSSSGGTPEIFLPLDPETDDDFHEVNSLPDSRGVVFVTHRLRGAADTIEVASEGVRSVLVRFPGESLSDPVYSNEGYVLFYRGGNTEGLWAVPFSLETLAVTGEAFLVDVSGSDPSVSDDGTLVFESFSASEFHLAIIRRDGSIEFGDQGTLSHFDARDLSPDGTQLLAVIHARQTSDLWMLALEGDGRRRLTFGDVGGGARWLPGGDAILYNHEGIVWRMNLGDGSSPVEVASGILGDVGPDGNTLVVQRRDDETQEDLWVESIDGSSPPRPFVVSPASETEAAISPNGTWVAYSSDESGRDEIYLRPLAGGDLKWQVSANGGDSARWEPDGSRLYYLENDLWVHEVGVGEGPNPSLTQPRRLFSALERVQWEHGYTPLAGGRGFVAAVVGREMNDGGEITVVTNWTQGLAN